MAVEHEWEDSPEAYEEWLDAKEDDERKEHNKWVEELKEGIETPELRDFIDRIKESESGKTANLDHFEKQPDR